MDTQNIYNVAVEMYEQGKYYSAIKLFGDIMDCYPHYSAACYFGRCLVNLGELSKAISFFKKLTTLCPDWEIVWCNLGYAYLKNNEMRNAWSCFLKAKEIEPNSFDVKFYLGMYYEKNYEYIKAIYYYKESLKEDECFEIHASLAVCYYDIKEYELALNHAKIAYSMKATVDNLFYYTRILVKMKQYYMAYNVFKATEINYDVDKSLLITDIICSLKVGDIERADMTYFKLSKIDNTSKMVCDYEQIKMNINQSNQGMVL